MQHTVTTSADGSSTLQLTQFGEAYHSTNGAYTEAMHIYIQCGLEHLYRNSNAPIIHIFDVGYGTGLNCILAWAWQQQLRHKGLPYPIIHYWGIEKFPIPLSEIEQLNYPNIIAQHTSLLPDNLSEVFHFMHKCPWEKDIAVPGIPHSGNKRASECSPTEEMCRSGNKSASGCSATETNIHLGNNSTPKCSQTAEMYQSGNKCNSGCSTNCGILRTEQDYREDDFVLHKSCADIAVLGAEYYRKAMGPAVVFYDTFSPATQPELWDEEIFRNIAAGCPAGSVLVTYCSKGTVKQALRNSGFTLERLAGPPGKRHILRGTL